MKARHSVSQTVITPLNPIKSLLDTDEYIIKPKLVSIIPNEILPSETSPSTTPVETVYMPDEIPKIPIRSIFSHYIK